ncbi:MAG: disulfide bond formation protein DsbA [Cellvibrionaceae bacterium]|nr:disulfide bond formation protein DsbA [Cellvibrionaceae bacterium]|tara:strand:- start:19087 stop:19755 length:669 start_codon:yes stop_codon:yes gene_type:complete
MSTSQPQTLRIDMVSDVVCPWCTIGYQKLARAIAQVEEKHKDLSVELHMQPFELNPQMPPEGQNVNEHIAEKYGADEATIAGNRARMKTVAAELGLVFNSDESARIYNTFNAHKLLHRAAEQGIQLELKLALFQAYFTDRENISDNQVLIDIAVSVGMDEQLARAALADEGLAGEVRAEQQRFINLGITSVPTFIINQRYSINGAQESQVLMQAFEDVLAQA